MREPQFAAKGGFESSVTKEEWGVGDRREGGPCNSSFQRERASRDGLREKLPEFFRQEATAELRRRGDYWVSVVIEADVGGGHLLSYQNFTQVRAAPRNVARPACSE